MKWRAYVMASAVALGATAAFVSCSEPSAPNTSGSTSSDGGLQFAADAGRPAETPTGEVYGHSDTVLYVVDTGTHAVREIGSFQGCTHVADIALDESSTIYASTGAELWLIENATARCTKIATGSFPNSLSFVPASTIEPNVETLVGYQGGDYVKIDPRTGAVTKIGSLGAGLESSGDMVSVKDGKSFLTVKGKDCDDCLVEVNPKTGELVKNYGSLGHSNAFGLAFWGGELYAFTDRGEVVLITIVGDALETETLTVPNAPANLQFRGAGSTTVAPIGGVK